jgi:hypothetical protein
MKKITFLLIFILTIVSQNVFSQTWELPEVYKFEVAEDYAKYEKDVIAGAKWLKESPFNENRYHRKEVIAFLMQWINGSPTVNVEINPTIMDFEKKNEGMLAIYMSACARYVLENNYSKDMRAKHRAALRDMMAVYKAGLGIKKDKKMEKLIKADEEGNIDEWLAENLKINQ